MVRMKPAIRKGVVNSDGKANIKIEVTHARKTRYISTKYYVDPSQFKKNRLTDKHPNASFINMELQRTIMEYEAKLITISAKIKRMDVSEILDYMKSDGEFARQNVQTFGRMLADEMDNQGREKNAIVYRTAINAVDGYAGRSIHFEDITYSFLTGMDQHLQKDKKGKEDKTIKGVGPNGRGNYFRTIRAIFNEALKRFDDDSKPTYLHPKYYPFKKFKIPKEKTQNRALTVEEVKEIAKLDLKGNEVISRDVFMLTLYLIGINTKDLFSIRKSSKGGNENVLVNGRIEFRRAKTSRPYSIRVEPEAMEIINRYQGEEMMLSFPEHFDHHTSFLKKINKYLKNVAELAKIQRELSTYYARHTWATIARNLDIPKDVIQKALGHATSSVTDTYIDFDFRKVDEANRKVIDKINL